MYDVALTVQACLRAGTAVDVAWLVGESHSPADALALTPGGGRVGSALAGAVDQVADLATQGATGRLHTLTVGEHEALLAGEAAGGTVRCALLPAADLPADLWDRLTRREPICLAGRLDAGRITATTLLDADTVEAAGPDAAALFGRRTSAAAALGDLLVTVLWPVPKLVVVGGGDIAETVARISALLGWTVVSAEDRQTATGLVAGLSPLDAVLIATHGTELAGPAIAGALDSAAGYIGALGGPRIVAEREVWLADRGYTDLSRVHSPAGLDLGATTPAENAVAILAEAIAARAGRLQ